MIIRPLLAWVNHLVTDEELKNIALHSAQVKITFYIHFSIYIIINMLLLFNWYFTGAQGMAWFIWLIPIWGVILVAHGISAFGHKYLVKATEQEYRRLKQEQEK